MRVTVCRNSDFNAAHQLLNPDWTPEKNREVFGKCFNPNYHGHNYKLTVKVTGEVDPETGYVMDLKKLDDLIRLEIHDRFDHRNLNLDCTEFKTLNPTVENISVVIWNLLRKKINAGHELTIVLYETERNFAEFRGA